MHEIKKSKNIVLNSIPVVIAIIANELVNVLMFVKGPVSRSSSLLLVWIILQTVSGLFFAYISDKHYRKPVLILSQTLGVLGGIVLILFNLEIWAIVLIALIFNPIPVARAALLDNFPTYRSLRIIGLTFAAQYSAWFSFGYLVNIDVYIVIKWILIILGVNIALTIFLFKDNYDKKKEIENTGTIKALRSLPVLKFILIAFVLSEITFYFMADYFEYSPSARDSFTPANLRTVFGIFIAMIYSRLPHRSIITLCYSIGAATMIAALVQCTMLNGSCHDSLITSTIHFCIIGGIYLPFVTDNVILYLGSQHRALGSALVEFAGTIAILIAALIKVLFEPPVPIILAFLSVFYILATFLQKKTEKFPMRTIK